MEGIPSGIVGLDEVIVGGLWPNAVAVIVGASGTGKSIFAMQYILAGLDNGEQGLYITLDVPPKQIIKEAILWGWHRVQEHMGKNFFFTTKGSDFATIIREQLRRLVEARKQYETPTRVVIDPLTPTIWAEKDKSVQRELINELFILLKQIGCVVAIVEEHAEPSEGAASLGASILLFLADGAIHLRYQPVGGAFNRTLEIIKMRGTRHCEQVYPYIFARGVGAIVLSTPVYHEEKAREHDDISSRRSGQRSGRKSQRFSSAPWRGRATTGPTTAHPRRRWRSCSMRMGWRRRGDREIGRQGDGEIVALSACPRNRRYFRCR